MCQPQGPNRPLDGPLTQCHAPFQEIALALFMIIEPLWKRYSNIKKDLHLLEMCSGAPEARAVTSMSGRIKIPNIDQYHTFPIIGRIPAKSFILSIGGLAF